MSERESSDDKLYTVIDRDAQRCREDIRPEDLGGVLSLLHAEGHRYELIDQQKEISEVFDGDSE